MMGGRWIMVCESCKMAPKTLTRKSPWTWPREKKLCPSLGPWACHFLWTVTTDPGPHHCPKAVGPHLLPAWSGLDWQHPPREGEKGDRQEEKETERGSWTQWRGGGEDVRPKPGGEIKRLSLYVCQGQGWVAFQVASSNPVQDELRLLLMLVWGAESLSVNVNILRVGQSERAP